MWRTTGHYWIPVFGLAVCLQWCSEPSYLGSTLGFTELFIIRPHLIPGKSSLKALQERLVPFDGKGRGWSTRALWGPQYLQRFPWLCA